MPRSIVFTLVSLCVLSSACSVEDAPEGEVSREAAKELADAALEDYLACEWEVSGECSSEREELVTALEELEAEVDGFVFRAGAVANCAGGTTVGCNGESCIATDNVGCACTSGMQLVDVGACPSPAKK